MTKTSVAGPLARRQRTYIHDDATSQVPDLVLFSELPGIHDFWNSIKHRGSGCGYGGSSAESASGPDPYGGVSLVFERTVVDVPCIMSLRPAQTGAATVP